MSAYLLGKVHVDGRRNNAVVPRIEPIARVVGGSAAQVIDHASEQVNLPPRFRSSKGVLGLGISWAALSRWWPISQALAFGSDTVGRHDFVCVLVNAKGS